MGRETPRLEHRRSHHSLGPHFAADRDRPVF